MASVYSDYYQTGTYTRTRVRVDYSGTTATAHLLFSRTNEWRGSEGAYGCTFNFGGASTSFGTIISDGGSRTDIEVASLSFGISMNGGTYSGSASSGNGIFDFNGSVYVPAQNEPVTGLTSSLIEIGSDYAVVKASITSYGRPSDAASRYIEVGVCGQNSYGGAYRYVPSNPGALTMQHKIDNDSRTGSTALSITPNTKYWYGAYATNTALGSSTIGDYFITKPAPFTSISATNNGDLVTVKYTRGNEGSSDVVSIHYSIDNGSTWTAVSAKTFIFTAEESGNVIVRATNSTGSTTASCRFTVETSRLYVGINNEAKLIKKLYIGVDGKAKLIKKLYVGVDGKAKKVVG